jgi:uncharacterized protein (UPF0333 family)
MENNSQVKPKGNLSKLLWILLAVILVPIILSSIFSGSSSSSSDTSSSVSAPSAPTTICDQDQTALQKSAQQISYKQLSKDPTSFQGQIATFRGQIIQIQQSGNEGVIRLSVTDLGSGYWSSNDVIYITYHQSTPAVEGDIVSVTGQLTGAETYTSQANFKITIPSMDVCSVNTTSPTKTTSTTPTKIKSTSSQTSTSNPQPTPTPTYTTPSGAVVTPNGTTVNAPPAPPASWHTVQTFSGSDTSNTSPFSVQGSRWQIQWTAAADASASTFCQQYGCSFGIQIMTTSDNTQQDYILENNINTASKSGSSYFYTPGEYYLKVSGGNMNNWTATVLDYY